MTTNLIRGYSGRSPLAPYQFDEAHVVKEEVLGFEIPVDDAFALQVIEGLNHTRHAEPRRQVIKVTPGSQGQRVVFLYSNVSTD